MAKRLPTIPNRKRICIICEGYEEFDYIQRLKELKIWDEAYSVTAKNAKSIDNIAAIYQNEYANDNYDLIVIFCDTEVAPHAQFVTLKRKLSDFLGSSHAYGNILFFANPCTLLIVLSHFGAVRLTAADKSVNAPSVEKLTGVADYRATETQRKAIMRKITAENYEIMKANLSVLPKAEFELNSTNFPDLLEKLEQNDPKWISDINKKLEKLR